MSVQPRSSGPLTSLSPLYAGTCRKASGRMISTLTSSTPFSPIAVKGQTRGEDEKKNKEERRSVRLQSRGSWVTWVQRGQVARRRFPATDHSAPLSNTRRKTGGQSGRKREGGRERDCKKGGRKKEKFRRVVVLGLVQSHIWCSPAALSFSAAFSSRTTRESAGEAQVKRRAGAVATRRRQRRRERQRTRRRQPLQICFCADGCSSSFSLSLSLLRLRL